jgi:cytoplasmic iron level regulating protein YaaA (DUF328/UPF0246 family)
MRRINTVLTEKSMQLLNVHQQKVGKRSLTHLINDAIVEYYGAKYDQENSRTVRESKDERATQIAYEHSPLYGAK